MGNWEEGHTHANQRVTFLRQCFFKILFLKITDICGKGGGNILFGHLIVCTSHEVRSRGLSRIP